MDENRFEAIAADDYQETTDPKISEVEGETVSFHATTQKVKSFVKFCIENQSSHVLDERRRELVPYTTSG